MNRNVYCPNKFSVLKVDLEKRLLYNCYRALPHRVTTEWLKNNPGQLFNTDTMLKERKEMLAGIRNSSCSFQCYKAEDRNATSLRTEVLKTKKTYYSNPLSSVQTLDITVNTDCNLSCVYCSGIHSSTWRREIDKFGTYPEIFEEWNKIYDVMSQKEKISSPFRKIFFKELELMDSLESVQITGGEPLLFNDLENMLDIINSQSRKDKIRISLFTGLGVSLTRFNNFLKLVKKYNNITVIISAEGLEKNFEFARYGSVYSIFTDYIKRLEEENIKIEFSCTLSNLGLFGFYDFYKKYNHHKIIYMEIHQPSFLQKHLLDDESKKIITQQWNKQNNKYASLVLQGLDHVPEEKEIKKLKIFLQEIRKRRKVSLDHLPKSFLDWLKI